MKLRELLLDLLYPPKCPFCAKLLDEGEGPICAKCESELPRASGGGKQNGDFFSVCLSPLYYEDKVRRSILRYKFSGSSSYCAVYGVLISECVREHLDRGYDIVSWVPLSRRRLRKRGYDQAMLMAQETAKLLSADCVRTLEKKRHNKAQSGISSPERRRANVSGAYRAVEGAAAGKRVLLIDDVCTTGATLSECARTLLMAGAEEVSCATLARKH